MQPPLLITSTKNDRIKALQRLDKASERRDQGIFPVEGKRELQKALNAGFTFSEVYYCPQLVEEKEITRLFGNTPSIQVSHSVFETIAYRENQDGIIGLCQYRHLQLSNLQLSNNPLLIVLEAVEKPGNLGAILRTADAAGVDAIIVCDPKTDIYNPNVVRASLGCVFSKSVISCSNEEALTFLRSNQIKSIATTPYTDSIYFKEDLCQPLAILMGTEADGLSDYWLKNADVQTKVPMMGEADSLNVSVCTAVVVYEALRQRLSSL